MSSEKNPASYRGVLKETPRFTEPTGFNNAQVAPTINGLNPGDKGYMKAWSKKNGIPYEE
jgi:hypothetical protein